MSDLSTTIQKAKSFIFRRQAAYRQVFNLESIAAVAVLEDLAKFCRANESCFHENERLHAVMEGRREVFNRLQHHLRLTQDQIWALYGRKDLE